MPPDPPEPDPTPIPKPEVPPRGPLRGKATRFNAESGAAAGRNGGQRPAEGKPLRSTLNQAIAHARDVRAALAQANANGDNASRIELMREYRQAVSLVAKIRGDLSRKSSLAGLPEAQAIAIVEEWRDAQAISDHEAYAKAVDVVRAYHARYPERARIIRPHSTPKRLRMLAVQDAQGADGTGEPS
jgi:quinol monooxygenase YgiN